LFIKTDKAREYWLTGNLDRYDFVLILPCQDSRLNALVREAFTGKLGGRRGIVIEGEGIEELSALYSLYAFTGKLIIGSFDEPCGRKLRNLLDCGIATEEELINDVILGAMK
jgi:hypothetical protein